MSVVSVSAAESKVGKVYSQGCSGLIAELLGMPWKAASDYRVGRQVTASTAAGTVVGWSGHVAVKTATGFIDCPGPNQAARRLSSYGSQTLYEMSY